MSRTVSGFTDVRSRSIIVDVDKCQTGRIGFYNDSTINRLHYCASVRLEMVADIYVREGGALVSLHLTRENL